MNISKVKVTDSRGDVNIYTDVSKVEISNDLMDVEYENTHATHSLEDTDEIVINISHA